MGEAPVLVHGDKKLTQSGVILTYLAKRSGKFRPPGRGRESSKRCAGSSSTIRRSTAISALSFPAQAGAKPPGDPAVLAFLKGRIDSNLAIVNKRLEGALTCSASVRPSPTFRWSAISIIRPKNSASTSRRAQGIAAWLDRIKALPGWEHPYDLMPGIRSPGGKRCLAQLAAPPLAAVLRHWQRGGRSSTDTVTVVIRSLRTTMSQSATRAADGLRPKA